VLTLAYLTHTIKCGNCQVAPVKGGVKVARKTQQVETRLVAEYLKEKYPQYSFITKQPLGIVSEELLKTEGYVKGLRMQNPSRPEVDAIVLLPRYFVLIEAKVWHIVDGMAKLPLYASLIPFTPELKQYQPREVIMELVVPWANPNLEIMCRDHNIRLVVYCPDWISEVVARVQQYGTREYRLAREQKLRDRQLLGLE